MSTPHDTSVATSRPNRPVLRWLGKRLRSWRVRHQLPFNFAIHMVGIPVAVAGFFTLFFIPWYFEALYWGLGGLFAGYLLQYVGHAAEGNDVGEWAAIKRFLGLPYVAIAPRWQDKTKQQV